MEVLRGQKASLESSEGFYWGSRSNLMRWCNILAPRTMKVRENQCQSIESDENHKHPWKSMKFYERRWKSSEDKQPTWNRAKVSVRAASRILCDGTTSWHQEPWKSEKINANLWKPMKNHWKPWKSISMKVLRGQEANLESSKVESYAMVQHPGTKNHENQRKARQIHERSWEPLKSIKICEVLWNAMRILRGQEASMESSKGSRMAAHRLLPSWSIMTPDPRKSTKIHEIYNIWNL